MVCLHDRSVFQDFSKKEILEFVLAYIMFLDHHIGCMAIEWNKFWYYSDTV